MIYNSTIEWAGCRTFLKFRISSYVSIMGLQAGPIHNFLKNFSITFEKKSECYTAQPTHPIVEKLS